MKAIRTKEVKRILTNIGATYKRQGKGSHEIWCLKDKVFVIPLHKEVSPGVLRDIEKAIQLRGLFEQAVQ